MEDLARDFLRRKRFAVAGSFRNEAKFAFRIMKDLLCRGYEVFPVNPGMSEVKSRTCYARVGDIPGGVDVVNLVTPPPATEKILAECLEAGITRVWFQPGAESPAALEFCRAHGIRVVHGMCVMHRARFPA